VRADNVSVQRCQFHLHTDGEFVNLLNANPCAEERWVEVDEAFAEALVEGGHGSEYTMSRSLIAVRSIISLSGNLCYGGIGVSWPKRMGE